MSAHRSRTERTLTLIRDELNADREPSALGLQEVVKTLFQSVDYLYEKGARNFVVLDVPPLDRSPYARGGDDEPLGFDPRMAQCVSIWNAFLDFEARAFTRSHPDASLFVVSTHALFDRLLDDPEVGEDDGDDKTEGVWMCKKDVPLSKKAQRYLAKEIALAFKRVEE